MTERVIFVSTMNTNIEFSVLKSPYVKLPEILLLHVHNSVLFL